MSQSNYLFVRRNTTSITLKSTEYAAGPSPRIPEAHRLLATIGMTAKIDSGGLITFPADNPDATNQAAQLLFDNGLISRVGKDLINKIPRFSVKRSSAGIIFLEATSREIFRSAEDLLEQLGVRHTKKGRSTYLSFSMGDIPDVAALVAGLKALAPIAKGENFLVADGAVVRPGASVRSVRQLPTGGVDFLVQVEGTTSTSPYKRDITLSITGSGVARTVEIFKDHGFNVTSEGSLVFRIQQDGTSTDRLARALKVISGEGITNSRKIDEQIARPITEATRNAFLNDALNELFPPQRSGSHR